MKYKFKRVHRQYNQVTPYLMARLQEYPKPRMMDKGVYSYRGYLFIKTDNLLHLGWTGVDKPHKWLVVKEEGFNLNSQPLGAKTIRDNLYDCMVSVTKKLGVHEGVKRIDDPNYPRLHGNALAKRIKKETEKLLRQDLLDLE